MQCGSLLQCAELWTYINCVLQWLVRLPHAWCSGLCAFDHMPPVCKCCTVQLTRLAACSQFMFGYGVGGEYPMAAGSAAERAEARGRASAKKRGREVVLTFSMQAR